jgi:primosomal replication protein N
MTSHANGLQDEAENNGNSGAAFFESVLRHGASSTAAVSHNLMKPVEAITRYKEMTRSPAGAAETVLLGHHSLQQHANGAPHNLMKLVQAITRDKAMTQSPSGAAETVLLGDHSLQQVSDLSWQADPLGGSVSSSESSRLYREEVHQLSLRRIVPVRTKDLAEYVRKLDDKTIDARRAQFRQTIGHCQSKLLGVNH